MKTARLLFVLAILLAPAVAQDAPPARNSTAKRDMNRRLGLVATRAIANFRSADAIENNLKSHGATLHPDLVSLRLRIESSLDEAEAAIGHDDLAAAKEALDRAQALLDRYAAKLGGG